MNEKSQIKAQCESCEGTGITRGWGMPKDIGVICQYCKGTGCDIIKYIPFVSRKKKDDIKKVYLPGPGKIYAQTVRGKAITYAKFLKGESLKENPTSQCTGNFAADHLGHFP